MGRGESGWKEGVEEIISKPCRAPTPWFLIANANSRRRYVARTREEHMRILERFYELTGKKDPSTQQIIGYRTRIIHIGDRLD